MGHNARAPWRLRSEHSLTTVHPSSSSQHRASVRAPARHGGTAARRTSWRTPALRAPARGVARTVDVPMPRPRACDHARTNPSPLRDARITRYARMSRNSTCDQSGLAVCVTLCPFASHCDQSWITMQKPCQVENFNEINDLQPKAHLARHLQCNSRRRPLRPKRITRSCKYMSPPRHAVMRCTSGTSHATKPRKRTAKSTIVRN